MGNEKKKRALTNAVFYAHEKPELLADLLADAIQDVASYVGIDGDSSIEVPSTGSVTASYTASVFSQFGDAIKNVSVSLDGEVTGVSISKGVVTVESTATADTFTLKAVDGSLSASRVIYLVKE